MNSQQIMSEEDVREVLGDAHYDKFNFHEFKPWLDEIRAVCEEEGWEKNWSRGGCYIHLETSEFIEALRGKGDPVDELGDVLFTLLAVADYYGIDPVDAIEMNRMKHRRSLANARNKNKRTST